MCAARLLITLVWFIRMPCQVNSCHLEYRVNEESEVRTLETNRYRGEGGGVACIFLHVAFLVSII